MFWKTIASSIFLVKILFPSEKGTSFESKIVWVDMAKLYQFCIESRDIKKSLNKKREAVYKKMNSIEKKILYKKKIIKKNDSFTYRQQKKLEEEILFLEESLKTLLYEKKIEMDNYERNLSTALLRVIYLTISKYARQHKIALIIDKGEYFYYENIANALDITDAILKKLE